MIIVERGCVCTRVHTCRVCSVREHYTQLIDNSLTCTFMYDESRIKQLSEKEEKEKEERRQLMKPYSYSLPHTSHMSCTTCTTRIAFLKGGSTVTVLAIARPHYAIIPPCAHTQVYT